ncbi:hypothetical protein CC80DRAFT_503007 [Byssothecium circinans]|uniref:Uncharacterized protein n=1 Tax=Byssothecium circinans TaxID=147558 RepID=A0A6A5U006_9PLEO|nr:hypothetical protein CC80DRAFT_503007 [Byssothecium circinans]
MSQAVLQQVLVAQSSEHERQQLARLDPFFETFPEPINCHHRDVVIGEKRAADDSELDVEEERRKRIKVEHDAQEAEHKAEQAQLEAAQAQRELEQARRELADVKASIQAGGSVSNEVQKLQAELENMRKALASKNGIGEDDGAMMRGLGVA